MTTNILKDFIRIEKKLNLCNNFLVFIYTLILASPNLTTDFLKIMLVAPLSRPTSPLHSHPGNNGLKKEAIEENTPEKYG